MNLPRCCLFLAMGVVSCVSSKPEAVEDTAVADPPARLDLGGFTPRNVVIVNVDTLRADALPQWGSPRQTMPALARREGWVYVDRAVSTASWTVPSVASLLTSRDLPAHGLRYVDAAGHIGELTVASHVELLRQQGWATALFTGSDLLADPALRLSTGFETTHASTTEPGNAADTVAAALAWLDEAGGERPFFLFLQPVDPHGPYQPEPGDQGTWVDPDAVPFTVDAPVSVQERQITDAVENAADEAARADVLRAVRGVYDEQVLGVDRALETLIQGLEALGHGEDTLVVLTADHGESFFDGPPAQLGHGFTPRIELVQVPLLFWGAGLAGGNDGGHVPCVASTLDVMPTVFGALGAAGPAKVDGRSLLDGCRTDAVSGVYEAGDDGEIVTWLAVTGRDAQVSMNCETGEVVAYDLARDPAATTPAASADVPDGPALAGRLDAYRDEVLRALPHLRCGR